MGSNPEPRQLNGEQVGLLRTQIMAYKLLCSNVSLPPTIRNKLICSDTVASHHLQLTQQAQIELDGQKQVPRGSLIALKLLYGALHTPKLNVSRIGHLDGQFPMVVPEQLNSVHLVKEREKAIEQRINWRMKQLEQMVEPKTCDLKLKATLEYKALRLFGYQKQIRARVLDELGRITEPVGSGKIGRRSNLRNSRFVDRPERGERARKERAQNLELVASVLERFKDFQIHCRNRIQQRSNKLGKAVMSLHVSYEKEEAKRLEKLARDRINALKAGDEEGYLKLLDQQKDTRLTYLLKQTDLYLEQLSHSVLAHKHENRDYSAETDTKRDYYTIAHSHTEAVDKQPEMLVGKLKDYQLKGLQWMVSLYNNKLNGVLADEMGLGKTIQTIALISYLLEKKNQTGPYLIIVPLSTMTNWSTEFERWAPSLVRVEYRGGPPTRKAIQKDIRHLRFNVLITTYEYVIKDKSFLGKIKWLYMIVDEGHRMKNAGSKLTLVLATCYSSTYRLILTGTPLQNNLPELWALLNFILPRIFNSKQGFDEWFNAPLSATGEKVQLNEEELLLVIKRLHKVLRPFLLRRLKTDVECELPEKVERIIRCPMSALQHRLYEMVTEKNLVKVDAPGKRMGIKRFNNTLMQLRKICNHPFVFEEVERQLNPHRVNNELLYRVSGKFELLSRILPKLWAGGHRILMFFQMTMVMSVMEDFLAMEGHAYLRLDGSTKSEDRSELLRQFNAPDSPYFVFLLSTRAGGLGLNLQSADTVIIFDSDWNPHQDLQAQDRAHRIGQTKEVRIFRLVTMGSIEELILARAQFKLSLDGKIIQAGKFDQKSTNEEREAMLRSLLDVEAQKRHVEETQGVLDDDELNELLARSPEELVLFKAIDREHETRLAHAKYSRLITSEELPSMYLDRPEPEKEELDVGRRVRQKLLVYDSDGDLDEDSNSGKGPWSSHKINSDSEESRE